MRLTTVRSLVAATLLLASTAFAQLNGTYTIDSSLAPGGGNYVTFAAAVTDVTTLGVSGPVQFIVYNGTGPYVGFAIAGAITGSSTANTVTFAAAPGHTPVVSGPFGTNVQTIKLGTAGTVNSGPQHVRLTGLTVQGAASGAAIICAGCSDIVISSCITQNCGTGINFYFTQNSTIQDCEVINCGMTAGSPGIATYLGGIGLADSSSLNVVQRNKIHDCIGNGFFMGGGGSNTAQVWNNVVINNMIWNCPGSGTYPGGLCLRRVTGSTVSNNSILMPAASANPGLHIMAAVLAVTPPVGAAAEVSNNMVKHLGSGGCVAFDVTSAVVPTIFDYNLYEAAGVGPVGKVGTTSYATLAAWQALAAPSLAGKELNSIAGTTGYLSGTDLHITPASGGFLNGSPVALVTDDIDLQGRPGTPCRGADETTGIGLFCSFQASPVTGPAALIVNFTDTTFTSDPGGVTSWSWDFENDGIVDSTAQHPSHVYLVPGLYSVRLTVTDAANPSSTLVRPNMINVGTYDLVVQTSGGGVGNLSIYPIPPQFQNPTAATGYLLISFATTSPVNTGPLLHLVPDATTWSILASPASTGDILHWNVTPGLFPTVPLIIPAGSLSFLAGVSADFVQLDLSPSMGFLSLSTARRVTF